MTGDVWITIDKFKAIAELLHQRRICSEELSWIKASYAITTL